MAFCALSCSLPGRWEAALAGMGLAMLVGVGPLALSLMTRQAVGGRDGWFFVVSALYLGLWRNVMVILGRFGRLLHLLFGFVYLGGDCDVCR